MSILKITLIIGLLGSFLMFLGDMFLYYDKNDYDSKRGTDALIEIMRRNKKSRLYLGGILGPLSAFLYCVGFYHIVLFVEPEFFLLGVVCFLLSCFGIIFGGAYHVQCAYLGLVGRHDSQEALNEVSGFLGIQKAFVFGFLGIGYLILAAMIVLKITLLPRWTVLLSPISLLMLTSLVKKFPKGIRIIVYGGWSNLVSVIYYIMTLMVLE